MKYVIGLVFVLTYQFNINGQDTNSFSGRLPSEASIAIGSLNMDKFRTYDLDYNEIGGSPYLEAEFLKGHAVMIDKKMTEEFPIQYDIYRQEFFYLNDDGRELVIDHQFVRELLMEGIEEAYHFKRINPQKPLKFYDILYESEIITIYRDVDISLKEGQNNGIVITQPKFSRVDKYFALQKGEAPKNIKMKKKNLYKYFSRDDQIIMDRIIKANNLSLKENKDVKKLFLYLEG